MIAILALFACADRAPPAAVRVAPARSSIGPTGPPASIVDCNGGGSYATIQAAIDAAPRDGWIQVEPCTYRETLDYGGKSLWIQGMAGSATTILDADGATAIHVYRGETDGTALVGFTIADAGTAVHVEQSALRLQDVVIRNSGDTFVIEAEGADLELDGVVIDGSNSASEAALQMDRGGLAMTRSSIACGSADAALLLDHGAAHIDWSTVSCPASADLALDSLNNVGRIHRSVFEGKVALLQEETHPDDRYVIKNSRFTDDITATWGTLVFENSILVGGTLALVDINPNARIVSSVFVGGGCAISSNILPIAVAYSDFWQDTSFCGASPDVVGSDGNFAMDPLWVDPPNGDYTPQGGSPLIEAGDPDAGANDVDGTRNDAGITGGKLSTLGGW